MKIFTRCLLVTSVFAICLFVLPSASADDWNKKTVVTFSAPFEVPGVGAQILPAGTYVFTLVDSLSDRHIVRITSEDGSHVYTTILAIPNYRLHSTDKTVMTFKERAEGQPEALRAWFYPGHQWGEEFVYPKVKAVELAKVSNETVLYTPVEIASVEDLKTAPIEAVQPTGEAVPLTAAVEAPPVEVAKMEDPKPMPATASYLPLLACLGLLSLGAAGVITKASA
ncbi:MAG TPA: hypothetical protein VN577_11560 [Terriglobales bacterium]|nr:hypothetical protein [Terriglobales bacterium]